MSKLFNWKLSLTGLAGVALLSLNSLAAQEIQKDPILFVVDPEHEAYWNSLEPNKDDGLELYHANSEEELKVLLQDENTDRTFLGDQDSRPLNKKQEKILQRSLLEQQRLNELLETLVQADFDREDDQAEPDFNLARDEIVKLVFFAETEKSFYQRLYIINKVYREHQEDHKRFDSLDHAIRDKWVDLEEKRMRIRKIIVNVSTVAGVLGGGFVAYKLSEKFIPIAATDKTIMSALKWLGKGSFIIAGTYVGASIGKYAGFLGSDMLLFRQFEFVDPIDENEDLRELLDLIDDL